MYRKIATGTGLVLALVLFLAVNILSNTGLQSARLDLTEQRLFTLSKGTGNILSGLEEPLSLRFYLSEKLVTGLPGVSAYAVRVRELLEEYARVAGGKIDLTLIDPEPFSEEEDRAVGYGLQGVPLNDGTNTFYFGLVGTSSTDEEEVIAFFQPDREEQLEHDLTQLVYRLVNPKQPVVGLISSLPIAGAPAMPFMPGGGGGGSEAWMIYDQMSKSFDIRTLEADAAAIPEDVKVLMVVHPKNLSEQTLYAIDQFVLRGGRLLAFLDPMAEADQTHGMGPATGSDFGPLLDAWGVELDGSKVAADLSHAKKVRFTRGGRNNVVDYPIWMDLPPERFDSDDVITSRLDVLSFASPGHLKAKEGATTELTPLVSTGPDAHLYDKTRLGPMSDPRELLRDYRPEAAYTLMARLSGTVKSAYPDGRPEAPVEDESAQDGAPTSEPEEPAEHVSESAEPVNVIVVADSDMLQDRFWVQVQNFLGSRIAIPTAANGTLVVNALENLSGSNDLISVRNRGTSNRPFVRLREIQQDAEVRYLEKEQELQARLRETEQKLVDLQQQKGGQGALVLSAEQQKEIAEFRDQKIRIRKDLRQVQHQLRSDIEALETRVKFINIGLVPLLIAIGGVIVGIRQIRRRKQIVGTATG